MEEMNPNILGIIPLTSIADQDLGDPTQLVTNEMNWFLTVLGEQARLAIHHLSRVWENEGDPPDPKVWFRMNHPDHAERIWGDIQAALFAGIIVSRMLKPSHWLIKDPALAARAKSRGRRLRALCGVEDGSPLTSIADVRNAFEHLDERMDAIVEAGDVASVSDLAIAVAVSTVRHVTLSPDGSSTPRSSARHVNMRVFCPDAGFLLFDSHEIDLWAWETALHNLLVAISEAHSEILKKRRGGHPFGPVAPRPWNAEVIADRQRRIREIRKEVRDADQWLIRPATRPGTYVLGIHSWAEPASEVDGERQSGS